MNTINIAGHDLIIFNDRPVGVSVSGGADSSLLELMRTNQSSMIALSTVQSSQVRQIIQYISFIHRIKIQKLCLQCLTISLQQVKLKLCMRA
jgi:tRNA(Ile)-lysidine synthase TilS/MesJ